MRYVFLNQAVMKNGNAEPASALRSV